MTRSTVLFLATSSLAAAQCNLQCYNGALCVEGAPDFGSHPVNSDGLPVFSPDGALTGVGDDQHCDCPPGLTGLFCDIEFQNCDDGEHKCYNGGRCVPGLLDEVNSDQLFCDCGSAGDDDSLYFGKYCEYEQKAPLDETYCVNGGVVAATGNSGSSGNMLEQSCNCPIDFEGPHCEYVVGSVPECTLDCQQGGQCRLGVKHYKGDEAYLNGLFEDGNADNLNSTMYCECPNGYYGQTCEVLGEACGDRHCFHGSACVVEEQQTVGDEVSLYGCDCSKAAGNNKYYGGRYCQYEATELCRDDGEGVYGRSFCVNGGVCRSNQGSDGCDCLDGFYGPICEFAETQVDDDDYEVCTMECQNGGQCRKGFPDRSYFDQFSDLDVGFLDGGDNDGAFGEYCHCPQGYTGHDCGILVQVCWVYGAHVCFHGSRCVEDLNGYICDCAAASVEMLVAGTYCEFEATSTCSTTSVARQGESSSFCVNDGLCVQQEDGLAEACTCPHGYEGPHCEFVQRAESNPPSLSPSNGSGSLTPSGSPTQVSTAATTNPTTTSFPSSGTTTTSPAVTPRLPTSSPVATFTSMPPSATPAASTVGPTSSSSYWRRSIHDAAVFPLVTAFAIVFRV